MSANAQDFDFDEYDKPGTERSRRRRGDDDTLESDLEEDLLEEDWLSGKKNPSEVSDEELNDDLLQSDDEDLNMIGQDVSLGMDTSYDQQDNSQQAEYTDDVVNLGAEGCEDEEEGYQQEDEEAYELRQEDNTEMSEGQMDYSGELAEDDDGYQGEVLDIQITEPIDGEFQDEDYQNYGGEALGEDEATQEDAEEDVGEEQQDEEEATTKESQVCETEEVEHEILPKDETKEESDEEEDEVEESGRIRFKSERKEGAVVRLADAGQRRNIPETLELSEKAKRDLMEFEEQERQKRQNRYGGRGRGGGRGGRGRGGFSGYGMTDFRGGQRRKMHDQMLPLMGNMGLQPPSRMPPPHQQQLQSHQHHPSRLRGPPPPHPFSEHGHPIPQQPLQPLIPPHMAHRSPPLRPQMEQPPRMMSSPPPNFPQHHHQQQQPPQPKNIHINPHFRGPVQSSVQVPLMPPAQSQSRPAVGPQRFPGMGDFQQHMPGNFGQPQRPPHHMEPLRNQPPQGPQEREPLRMGDCPDSTRFPAQHMFDHQGPGSLMNSSNNLHQQQLPGQGHMGFGPPGPPFNQPGQGSIGLFQREIPRPNLPPHQGHQGMMNLNQQGGSPNQPRPFMGPRQPFGQQGNPFPPPQVQFGMQGLMHGPPVSHLPHHDPMSPHPMHQHQHQQQQHHHRQELSHQQQINLSESRPMTHHGQNPFHQQHGSPRQMTPRPQNPQQRNMSNRQRMNAPISKQMQQRNSNLRELPVAPGNTNMHSSHPTPTPTSPAANIKPVARATPGTRPGLSAQPTSGSGRGRGQVAKTESQPGGAVDRTMVNRESPNTPTSAAPQDPDEDEETRQYRLKIEEQKRLREEILRRKELRRQMQAGVRKKELLERLNSHTPNQGPTPTQTQPVPSNQQKQHPVQQQQQTPQQLQQQQKQPQLQTQQQRQVPRRTQQTLNHTLKNPNQDDALPPSSDMTPCPNVKACLQMVKGGTQEQHTLSAGPQHQWMQPQQNVQQLQQQRRNSSVQDSNVPNAPVQPVQVPPKNTPATQGPAQIQGPKLGAKRTVMQRIKNSGMESQQVPQKVRVVKLSGLTGKGPEATSDPVQQQQQQSSWQASLLNQGVQRKVTMMGQQQLGPGGAPQASQGGRGNTQQSRVVVSGRGRGRGGGQMGRGQSMSTRQNQRAAENPRCTVSIEGLSTSTTEFQLKNLLRSIGPIEMFKIMPQQRKAIAKFSNPQHAASFQMSFNRHMIDLSHIDVSLIDG